jgi:hypothetical protein
MTAIHRIPSNPLTVLSSLPLISKSYYLPSLRPVTLRPESPSLKSCWHVSWPLRASIRCINHTHHLLLLYRLSLQHTTLLFISHDSSIPHHRNYYHINKIGKRCSDATTLSHSTFKLILRHIKHSLPCLPYTLVPSRVLKPLNTQQAHSSIKHCTS